MKTLFIYLNEKGQDIVEYAIILAFCTALVMGLKSDVFNDTLREVFERGAYDDVSTSINAGTYAQAGKIWSQSSRRTLNDIQYNNGRYYLGEDIVSNEKRLEVDRAALTNIANFFLGMSVETAKVNVFNDEFKKEYNKEGKLTADNVDKYLIKGTDILLLNFYDEVYGIEDKYDPNTQQYEDGATARTSLETKERRYDKREVMYWMQGIYGYTDPNDPNSFNHNNYNTLFASSDEFKYDAANNMYYSDKRYFFSNQMIDPDSSYTGGTVKRNIRVNIKSSDGVTIDSITVRAQRNGQDIPGLKVTETLKKNQ